MALRKPAVTNTEATKELVDQPGTTVVDEPVVEAVVETKAAVVETVKEEVSKEAVVKEDEGKDAEAVVVEAAAEQVQQEEPVVEVVAELKQVAVQSAANSAVVVPHKANNAMANFTEEMAAEGFEGMNLTGMSFERVKLHEAMFQLGSEDTSLGERIEVQVMSTRNQYIVRQYKGNGAEIFYSYDPKGLTKTDGSSAEETLAEWREDGYGVEGAPLEIKRYIEAMAILVNRDDEHEGLVVSLSIPPASTDRLAGAFAVGKQMFKAGPSNLIIECKVGKKIGTGEEAFRPWIFKALRAAS